MKFIFELVQALDRIKARGRGEENSIPLQYLQVKKILLDTQFWKEELNWSQIEGGGGPEHI